MDYTGEVKSAVAQGDINVLLSMAFGRPCACLGQQRGDELCPCLMLAAETRRQIVPAWLKRGRIVAVAASVAE